jgi:spore maturation protein CgeB
MVVLTTPFGILEDPDHKHTFYLSGFTKLVAPHFETRSLTVIGKRICFRGSPKLARESLHGSLPAPDLLEISERAFQAAENNYLLELNEIHTQIKELAKRLGTQQQQISKHLAQTDQLQSHRAELLEQVRIQSAELEESSRLRAIQEARIATLNDTHATQLEERDRHAAALTQSHQEELVRMEGASQAALLSVREELNRRLEQQRATSRSELSRCEHKLELVQRRCEELSAQATELSKTQQLLAQKDRYIQHLRQQLRAAERQIDNHRRRAQHHMDSVRYQLGDALLLAARPSRDTLALPGRLARLVGDGLRNRRKRGEFPFSLKAPKQVSLSAPRTRKSTQAAPGSTTPVDSLVEVPAPAKPIQTTPSGQGQARVWLDVVDRHKPERAAQVRVCAVLDEFSAQSFLPECQLLQPRPDNWESLARYEHPDLLLVESAWKGNDGAWQYRVARYASPPGRELVQMNDWFRQAGLPTIFWNKEDPVHYEQFLDSARNFDVVLTTDQDRIPAYRAALGHDRIAALPFAAQPRIHNPVALPEGRNDRVCFAGSYYANRFDERRAEMEMLLDAATGFPLDIFDRNHGTTGPGSEHFLFPDRFQPFIRGRLPYRQVLRAYKQYRVFLNVNSVIDSPTMFSRRVFELLACGTPVVSTWCRGIEELLGSDVVWLVRDADQAREAIATLLTDKDEWNRRSLEGIRRVMTAHTYRHRFQTVLAAAELDLPKAGEPQVLLIAKAVDAQQAGRLHDSFDRLGYADRRLLAICPAGSAGRLATNDRIVLADPDVDLASQVHQLRTGLRPDLIGWLDPTCEYGEQYLQDLVNAWAYSGADLVGKAESDRLEFTYQQPLHPAGSLASAAWLDRLPIPDTDLLAVFPIDRWVQAGARSFCADQSHFSAGPAESPGNFASSAR